MDVVNSELASTIIILCSYDLENLLILLNFNNIIPGERYTQLTKKACKFDLRNIFLRFYFPNILFKDPIFFSEQLNIPIIKEILILGIILNKFCIKPVVGLKGYFSPSMLPIL